VGKPDASPEEIQIALERAQASDFIAQQTDGVKTSVGERGRSLSGGERQRLSIAKHTHRLVERYTVFRKIACGFLIVPFKLEHAKHLKGLT
jgi:ABC-type lipopolysaccharide export system ATPase subunit